MGNTCVTMHSLHLGGQEYFDEIKLLFQNLTCYLHIASLLPICSLTSINLDLVIRLLTYVCTS